MTGHNGKYPSRAIQFSQPLVSIIMLLWNQLDYTKKCLESLEQNTWEKYELILVDNGSTDGTKEFIHQFASTRENVRVISNSSNKGFGGGNNQGLSIAAGEYILFLNNDVILTPGWLTYLVDGLRNNPGLGLIGPVTNYISGPQCIPVSYGEDFQKLSSFSTGIHHQFKNALHPVAKLVGYCLLTRKAVIDQIGGFDPLFEVGDYEDDDLCLRAGCMGWGAAIARDVFIHHFGSRTYSDKRLNHLENARINLQKFKNKWNLPAAWSPNDPLLIDVPSMQSVWSQRIDLPNLSKTHRCLNDGKWWEELAGIQPAEKVPVQIIPKSHDLFKENKPVSKEGNKILFVVHGFPPQLAGGTEAYTYRLAKAIQQLGHNVEVFCPQTNQIGRTDVLEQQTFDRIRVWRYLPSMESTKSPQHRNTKIVQLFENLVKQGDYDLIHVQHLMWLNPAVVLVAKRLQIPVVITLHDFYFLCSRVFLLNSRMEICQGPSSPQKCLECLKSAEPQEKEALPTMESIINRQNQAKLVLNSADLVMAPSRYVADKFHSYGFIDKGIKIWSLGLNSAKHRLPATKSDKITFAVLGNLAPLKGTDLPIRAYNWLDLAEKAKLWFYGNPLGEYGVNLLEQINLMRGIEYKGPYKQENLAEIFAKVDAVIVPSLQESYSFVVREALIHKIPVIASAAGGIPEIIKDGYGGLLFEPGDWQALAGKMKAIVDKPELLDELRDKIPAVREMPEEAAEMLKIYTGLIDKDKSGPGSPQEILEEILNSDDIPLALLQHEKNVDERLICLIKENSQAERALGNAELSDSLDLLAEFIRDMIHEREKVIN